MPQPISAEKRSQLLIQIFSLFVRQGFEEITMDEIASQIRISKATLYKYFRSKDDLVAALMDEIFHFLNEVAFMPVSDIEDVMENLSRFYQEVVLVATYTSSRFMIDLKKKRPDLHERYFDALKRVLKIFRAFYELCVEEGYFRRLSIQLVGEQIQMVMPAFMSEDYLKSHHTDAKSVICEYYRLLLCQLLSPDYASWADRESSYRFVEDLLSRLKENFLVQEDSKVNIQLE